MKRCRRSIFFVLLLLCTALFAMPVSAEPKFVLKLGHAVPEENAYHYGAVRFKELVEEKIQSTSQKSPKNTSLIIQYKY